jgi:hypothetical protein
LATLPAVLPRWATKSYGQDDLAWTEAKAQCRRALVDWAAAKEYRYYSDLVPVVSAIAWPEGPYTHSGQQIGTLLGQVSLGELDRQEDRPLISALVVSKEDNLPSGGFWSLLDELGMTVGTSWDARVKFWATEVERCFETYGKQGKP